VQAEIVFGGYAVGGILGAYIGYQAQNNPRLQSLVIATAAVGCGSWAAVCNGVGQGMLASSYGASEGQAWDIGARAALTTQAFIEAGFAGRGEGISEEVASRSWQRYVAHGAAGCITSVANGGKCGHGIVSAVAGKWVTNNTTGADWNDFTRGVATAVSGGAVAAATGGSFSNGARTAAYGYLYNQLRASRTSPCMMCGIAPTTGGSYDDMPVDGERSIGQRIYDGLKSFGQAVSNIFTTQESAQPNEKDLIKVPEKDGNKEAKGADYDDAHDAKKGRGKSSVNIYVDKGTKQRWLWNGVRGSEKEPL
jgi:hypothetical protein